MKAAEPDSAPKAEKYGMPAQYAPRIVERHFGVVDDEAALAGAQAAHDIKISKALRDADARRRQANTPASAPSVTPSAEALAEAQDWRAKLGLG